VLVDIAVLFLLLFFLLEMVCKSRQSFLPVLFLMIHKKDMLYHGIYIRSTGADYISALKVVITISTGHANRDHYNLSPEPQLQ
jgi:hypothetical protein